MKEEWKKVCLRDGRINEWYSISNHGNLISHLQNRPRGGNLGFDRSYNPNVRIPVKFSSRSNKDGSIKCLYRKLTFPSDFFEHFNYSSARYSTNIVKEVLAHQLVMWAFKPIDKFPPDKLKSDWEDAAPALKLWIRECSIINHIDHNPANNHVDNLEWSTPEDNSHKAIKFYGGNCANKNKVNSPIITETYINPLAAILEHA